MRAVVKNMRANKFDQVKYGKILQTVCPQNIENNADYQKISGQISNLIDAGSKRTNEESIFLKLLITLAEEYERKHKHLLQDEASPIEVLQYLMEEHNHTAKDLWPVIGDRGLVSRILHGERSISKQMAEKLADFYHVVPAVFIFNSH